MPKVTSDITFVKLKDINFEYFLLIILYKIKTRNLYIKQ